MRDLVVGLTAIVVAVIAGVTVDFAREHARGRIQLLLGAAALALTLLGANVLWAVLGGLVVGAVVLGDAQSETTAPASGPEIGFSRRRLALSLLPGLLVAAGAAVAAVASGRLAVLVADMAKIGTIALGNGTTVLPVLRADVVASHHWLTPQQFAAGVGLGQATPGPILITATFVGFRVAGWWGALLATAAIFAPSIAMTTVAAEVYPYLRRLTRVRGAIRGVMAAFVGPARRGHLRARTADRRFSGGARARRGDARRVARAQMRSLRVFGVGLAAWGLYLLAGGPA